MADEKNASSTTNGAYDGGVRSPKTVRPPHLSGADPANAALTLSAIVTSKCKHLSPQPAIDGVEVGATESLLPTVDDEKPLLYDPRGCGDTE